MLIKRRFEVASVGVDIRGRDALYPLSDFSFSFSLTILFSLILSFSLTFSSNSLPTDVLLVRAKNVQAHHPNVSVNKVFY